MLPLATEHNLEMRHGMTSDLAADTVKSQVGDVMLSATVEAAASNRDQLSQATVATVGGVNKELRFVDQIPS